MFEGIDESQEGDTHELADAARIDGDESLSSEGETIVEIVDGESEREVGAFLPVEELNALPDEGGFRRLGDVADAVSVV